MEVGINKKEPSFNDGINSFPVFFIMKTPEITKAVGIERNNNLFSKHHLKILV